MNVIKNENKIEIYNEGILIIEGNNFQDIIDIATMLLKNNTDLWEVEILNKVLYTVSINLSTQEVA